MHNNTMKLIPIYVMGRRYDVPEGLTIQKALEFSGFQLKRGCGCRGGVCGACVTVYRKRGKYKLNVGLACQTVVEEEMDLVQLPYASTNKSLYAIEDIDLTGSNITELYPELLKCMGCNACTKACPMDLQVMNYVSAAIRGDFPQVVELSMECIMCGMCAARCPAELSPLNIALLIRRVYGKKIVPPADHLKQRLTEIKEGKYNEELKQLKTADTSEIEKRYKEFQATKGAAV